MRRSIKIVAAAMCTSAASLLLTAVAGAAPAPTAERWALLIGVSDYQPPTVTTPGSANDARDMRDVLVGAGWPQDHMRVLIDGDATAGAIREGMDWLADKSSPTSFSVVHYSGHTKQIESDYDDGDEEQWDEYLWSVDNEFISDGEFGDRMRAIEGHAWINVSNCEAAGFDDGVSSPNRLFTAASEEDEKGYERGDTQRSIYTGLLAGAFLNKHGDADRNGAVSIQEAFAVAAAAAPQLSVNGEYGPQHPVMAGGDNTQWFLKPPTPTQQTPKQQKSLLPPGLIPPWLIPPGLLPEWILPVPQTP
ncbi:MAG: caspase family protein [Actinobacteria bacterium]|nr:caspase family protein [Actinomycetota bacterium]